MSDFRPGDFREAVARFRDALRQEGERSESPGLQAILSRNRSAKSIRPQRTRVAWAAAAVVALMLGAIPAYERALRENARQRAAEQEKADAQLLEQVNAGLARSVPRAMAPLMDWTPGN